DGDLDLFVGSRSVPYNYGITPVSYIYNNDGNGHFTDVTDKVSPEIKKVGMVKAALWADLDGTPGNELVITGEWMPTRIFHFDNKTGKFIELKDTGLDKLSGWWQSLAGSDLNGDGKTDLVIGNVGKNFYLQPSETRPARLWLNDFDMNGSREQFLTRTVGDNRDVPVFLKREITDQFPGLKKANLKHSDYAKKTIQELFTPELLKQSVVREFNYAASIVAISDGKGHFTISELPLEVQMTSVNAISFADVDHNGTTDVMLAGNMFTFPPQFGRLDAGYGQVLLNNGKASFNLVGYPQSGLQVKEEVKGMIQVKGKGSNLLVLAVNNEMPLFYRLPANR
ncbi:MAG: CRTAC1 family protein, partial [Chitinophagaceae bacterium]